MRKRSGTLEIGFRSGGRPEDYEGEYQCFASNDFGVALSNKILLRVSSKKTHESTRYYANFGHNAHFEISSYGYKVISTEASRLILEKMKKTQQYMIIIL